MSQIARGDGFMGHFGQLSAHIAVARDPDRYVVTFSCPFSPFITRKDLTRIQTVSKCREKHALGDRKQRSMTTIVNCLSVGGLEFTKWPRWSIKTSLSFQCYGHTFIVWVDKLL